MSDVLKPSVSLLSKLAAIAVHAEDALSPDEHDQEALKSTLADAEVVEWLTEMKAFSAVRETGKYIRQWLACLRLNYLVAKRRRKEANYMKRRQAAKVGWERRRAM